jgi:threonylcarbamoyladenosine tRNA methylthiotransferase MtaB
LKNPEKSHPPKVAIHTLGCKVNQFESACLGERFQSLGWGMIPFKEEADLYIINTCAVTAEAQRQSAQMVRKTLRDHPKSQVIAAGCAGQLFPETFEKIPGLHYVMGHHNKMQIPDLVALPEESRPPHKVLLAKGEQPVVAQFPLPKEKTRAFLCIQDGCNAQCSYCLVPRARGRSRSLAVNEVLSGATFFNGKGIKELVLTGIHLGQYGDDLNPATTLTSLLEILLKTYPHLYLRLSSLEPQEVTPALLDQFTRFPNLCPHLHIPLQSGDDFILQKMNRTYSVGFYRRLIQTIHRQMPLAALGTDLIVGFPGEGEAQFQGTTKFLSEIPFSYIHIFPFSPRPGTSAAAFPDPVADKIKKERLQIIRAIDRQKRKTFIHHCLGKEFSALTLQPAQEKGWTKVLTENYLTVSIPGRLIKNERIRIRLKALGPDGLKGELRAL